MCVSHLSSLSVMVCVNSYFKTKTLGIALFVAGNY